MSLVPFPKKHQLPKLDAKPYHARRCPKDVRLVLFKVSMKDDAELYTSFCAAVFSNFFRKDGPSDGPSTSFAEREWGITEADGEPGPGTYFFAMIYDRKSTTANILIHLKVPKSEGHGESKHDVFARMKRHMDFLKKHPCEGAEWGTLGDLCRYELLPRGVEEEQNDKYDELITKGHRNKMLANLNARIEYKTEQFGAEYDSIVVYNECATTLADDKAKHAFYLGATQKELLADMEEPNPEWIIVAISGRDVDVILHEPTSQGHRKGVAKQKWIETLLYLMEYYEISCHLKDAMRFGLKMMLSGHLSKVPTHTHHSYGNDKCMFLQYILETLHQRTGEEVPESNIMSICKEINEEDGLVHKRKKKSNGCS